MKNMLRIGQYALAAALIADCALIYNSVSLMIDQTYDRLESAQDGQIRHAQIDASLLKDPATWGDGLRIDSDLFFAIDLKKNISTAPNPRDPTQYIEMGEQGFEQYARRSVVEGVRGHSVFQVGRYARIDGRAYEFFGRTDVGIAFSQSRWLWVSHASVFAFLCFLIYYASLGKRRAWDAKAIMADNTKLRNDITFLRTSQHENIDPFGAGDSDEQALLNAYFAACKLSILCDKFGVIVKVNHRMCLALGYREEELVGQPMRMVLPDDDEYNDHDAILQKFIETPFLEDSKLIESMVQARHKDGHLITLTLTRFVVPVWKGTQKTVYGGAVARVKGE